MRPPFYFLCYQDPLPLCGYQLNSSVTLLHAQGWLAMRPPILQLGIDFIYFIGPSFFLLRSLLLLSRGSLGEASEGLISWLLAFASYFYLWAFSPFFPQGKVQPFASLENPMPEPMQGMDERENDGK